VCVAGRSRESELLVYFLEEIKTEKKKRRRGEEEEEKKKLYQILIPNFKIKRKYCTSIQASLK
jgi:hypothetical protein